MVRQGQTVAFTGNRGHDGEQLGDTGRALIVEGSSVAVRWDDGRITTCGDFDLAVQSRAGLASLDDSLDVGGLVTFATRDIYDEGGCLGVVTALAEGGHLGDFRDIAEEALALVASRVRSDPSIRAVTAQLDDEEGDAVVRLASAALIRDAFTEEG